MVDLTPGGDPIQTDFRAQAALIKTKVNDDQCTASSTWESYMWYRSKTDAATGTTYEVVAPNDCPSLRSANLLALIAANKAIDSGDSTDCK